MDTYSKKPTTSLKASTHNAKGDTRPNDFSRPVVFNPPGKPLHHARFFNLVQAELLPSGTNYSSHEFPAVCSCLWCVWEFDLCVTAMGPPEVLNNIAAHAGTVITHSHYYGNAAVD
ncbi:hypothetical protein CEXT_29811 [Caerostris extrusa]|uniref:Uncharacterized protein n=1 Tax=Caerostris extrusa TaxID=172846 RepID=A0AAV4U608_CAEEX|nr:hypothetical protein CEXT_29811 [Caerostris extrusa]